MGRHLRLARAAPVTVVPVPDGPPLYPSPRKLQIENDVGHARGNPYFRRPHLGTGRGSVVEHHLLFDDHLLDGLRCLFDASADRFVGSHVDLRSLVIPVRGSVDLFEFGQRARELAEGPLETDLKRTDVHGFQFVAPFLRRCCKYADGVGDHCGSATILDIVRDQFAPQLVVGGQFPTSPQKHGGAA